MTGWQCPIPAPGTGLALVPGGFPANLGNKAAWEKRPYVPLTPLPSPHKLTSASAVEMLWLGSCTRVHQLWHQTWTEEQTETPEPHICLLAVLSSWLIAYCLAAYKCLQHPNFWDSLSIPVPRKKSEQGAKASARSLGIWLAVKDCLGWMLWFLWKSTEQVKSKGMNACVYFHVCRKDRKH